MFLKYGKWEKLLVALSKITEEQFLKKSFNIELILKIARGA